MAVAIVVTVIVAVAIAAIVTIVAIVAIVAIAAIVAVAVGHVAVAVDWEVASEAIGETVTVASAMDCSEI